MGEALFGRLEGLELVGKGVGWVWVVWLKFFGSILMSWR